MGWSVGAALSHQVCGDWLCSRVHVFDLRPSELHTQNLLLHFFIVRACISLHWPLPCSSYAPAHRRFPLGSLCSWTVWGGFELISVAVPPGPDPCFAHSRKPFNPHSAQQEQLSFFPASLALHQLASLLLWSLDFAGGTQAGIQWPSCLGDFGMVL